MALDFFAGSIGGISGVIVGHPFDTVKVRLQTQPRSSYSGMIQCFTKIIKEETVFGLYKGLLPPLAGFAAMNSVMFGVHGMIYRRLEQCRTNMFMSASIAGVAQSFIVAPLELVKTQMQLQGQGVTYKRANKVATDVVKDIVRYTGPMDCIRKIYRTSGIRGCFRGLVLTCAREGPAMGVYITLYHELCQLFARPYGTVHDLGIAPLLLAGGLTGSISWITTYQVDVVKSRYQANLTGKYSSILDCARQTYNSEGPTVFVRGLSAAVVRGFPVNAATLATVTIVLRYANPKPTAKEETVYRIE